MAQLDPHLPFVLDPRDPNFKRESQSWAFETQCQINELIAATKRTLAQSRQLMAEADRILGRNIVATAFDGRGGETAALNNASAQIRECVQRAEECARKAAIRSNPATRDNLLELETRWRELAQSIEHLGVI